MTTQTQDQIIQDIQADQDQDQEKQNHQALLFDFLKNQLRFTDDQIHNEAMDIINNGLVYLMTNKTAYINSDNQLCLRLVFPLPDLTELKFKTRLTVKDNEQARKLAKNKQLEDPIIAKLAIVTDTNISDILQISSGDYQACILIMGYL